MSANDVGGWMTYTCVSEIGKVVCHASEGQAFVCVYVVCLFLLCGLAIVIFVCVCFVLCMCVFISALLINYY